jgi:hypothetical protein
MSHTNNQEFQPSPNALKTLCLYVRLSLFALVIGCSGPDKDQALSTPTPQPQPTPAPQTNLPESDPTFVNPADTVSAFAPRRITRSITRDKAGNLWFASWDGIVRYDGKLFTNFTLKEGLRRFHVFSVLEDRSGNLWFGTVGGGVYRYDGQSFVNLTERNGLVHNTVNCIFEDNLGGIWFGTGGGASRLDGQSFANFTEKDGLSHNLVTAITQDEAGTIWFGTRRGICSYNGQSFAYLLNKAGAPYENIWAAIKDRSGQLWFGAASGLWRYDGKTMVNISANPTNNLFEDRSGNLWISSGGELKGQMALYRYDGAAVKPIPGAGEGINQIFGICEDTAGHIWFGTSEGVRRYDGKGFSDLVGE